MYRTALQLPLKQLQQTPKILMCRPTFFQIQYSINPWMNTENRVDQNKAIIQWESLKKSIEDSGAEVEVMEQPKGSEQCPDLVFAANSALVRDDKAYISTFRYPERRKEQFFFNNWFTKNGYKTFINTNIPFEGAGDALWAGKNKLFCGVGPRTDIRALNLIGRHLNDIESPFRVIGCKLVDQRFYHIDTCFCPLNEELAIYFPKAFDDLTIHNMSNDIELVSVSEDDAARFCCNAVVVGNVVIMNKGSEKTALQLEKLGFDTIFVDMSEFIKSGGSSKCCILSLN